MNYSTLGIALGLAGAGNAWTGGATLLGLPPGVAEVLFAAAALWWGAVLVARVPVTVHRLRHLRADIQHPTTGPFPAFVPVVALLLTIHYAAYLPREMTQAATLVWVIVLAGLSAQMLAFWLSGELDLKHVHPGYALPVIAGPYIAAIALSVAGFPILAIGAAGAGTFSWATVGTLIFVRLVASTPLPPAMSPSLAVLVAPPITAGLAWFAIRGGEVDPVQQMLAGTVIFIVLAQVFMIPKYLSAPFSPAFWTFTFPAAALASYAVRWEAASPGTLATVVAVIALTFAAFVILAVAAASIWTAFRARRHRRGHLPRRLR